MDKNNFLTTALFKRPVPTALYWQQQPWRRCLSINSSFCKAVVNAGYLTWQQMLDVVCCYRLGASRKGGVIFWQIDSDERICDGKVMYYNSDCHRCKDKSMGPTWVSALLARRLGERKEDNLTRHCLFGLHLLNPCNAALLAILATAATGRMDFAEQDCMGETTACSQADATGVQTAEADALPSVAVVEAEKTAVILSVRYPQYVWLATGGLFEVQPNKFRPLRGRKVILFPDTDPDGTAYNYWYQAAQRVMAEPFWEGSPPIRVSALLEQQATAEQKSRKIDLVDFIC